MLLRLAVAPSRRGQVGHGNDLGQAARWYRASAEKGNVFAQFNLARLYERG